MAARVGHRGLAGILWSATILAGAGLAGCGTTSSNQGSFAEGRAAARPDFVAPLESFHVSSYFGMRGSRPHKGIDLKAVHATPISAAGDGRVSYAGWMRGFGKIVIVDHGRGRETYYAHMSRMAVEKGHKVRQGQVIGFVGATGNATGPHLHFELREDGRAVDPMLYLNDSPKS